jgi:hypothetical protein
MRKVELRKIGVLKRVLNSSVAAYFARAFELIKSETLRESNSQTYPELIDPYVAYDEQKRVKLQLLEFERQKAEAINSTRHHTYT